MLNLKTKKHNVEIKLQISVSTIIIIPNSCANKQLSYLYTIGLPMQHKKNQKAKIKQKVIKNQI